MNDHHHLITMWMVMVMRLLLLFLLPLFCHAELQQRKASEVADILNEEIKDFYAGQSGQARARTGRFKHLNMQKVKAHNKAKKFANTAQSNQLRGSPAADAISSNETADAALDILPPLVIEPDTPLASLWYPPPSTKKGWKEYFETETEDADKYGVKNSLPSPETQCVYLDFNQKAPYTVDILNTVGDSVGKFGPFHGYYYTKYEKEAILDRLNRDYHLYNVYFTLDKPKHDKEPYTTIRFNANDFPNTECPIKTQVVNPLGAPPGLLRVASVLFGLAPGIDYLNLIRDDLVRVQANLWSFLVEIDPTGALFTLYTGIPVANKKKLEAALSFVTINQSANTASHELAHALGLRHHDAFGAPGDGLPITGRPAADAYYAPYPGPTLADETTLHLMATSVVLGLGALDWPDIATDDRFFSERSSVKLSLAEGCGNFMSEREAKEYGTEIDGMPIPEFFIQNPIEEGENKGGRYLRIDTVNIAGSIKDKNEVDRYRLYLKKDRVFSAEVISYSSTLKDRVMTTLTLLKVSNNGGRQVVAVNDFGFEGFDPHIFDFVIPETGTYVLAVGVQQTIPIDREPHGVPDGVYDDLYSVKELGGEAFLEGEYNLLIYNHHDPIQKHKYRDDYNLCMPTKKKELSKHSGSHSGHYYSSEDDYHHSYSISHSYDDDESYSTDYHYQESSSSSTDYHKGHHYDEGENHGHFPIKWQEPGNR